MDDLLLMCGNQEVMHINLDTQTFDVISEELLPFRFKNALRGKPHMEHGVTRYYETQVRIFEETNQLILLSWLAGRTLLLSRKNAKKLYQAFRLEQLSDELSRAKLSIACRALSVLDNYWVKLESDPVTWEKVNLRHISLNESVAQIALHGVSLSLDGSLQGSPEFLTNGSYAKCWRRYPDGRLWLHKAGEHGSFESRTEVAVSDILDRCNVAHCHYEAAEDDGLYVCACPAMTDDDRSIVDGSNYTSYLLRSGKDVERELQAVDPDSYYKMQIVDYLIANTDRHSQNWGMFYDPKTTRIIGMHPLFDHNNAFDKEAMQDEDFKSHFGKNRSLKENAMYAIKQVDFHFTGPITRELFLTDRQYECFMRRAGQLKISEK